MSLAALVTAPGSKPVQDLFWDKNVEMKYTINY